MKILMVAGPVSSFIDAVRRITNIASGKTGVLIAEAGAKRGHHGVLLTSIPPLTIIPNWEVIQFLDFSDLHEKIKILVNSCNFDVIIVAAAISDYLVDGFSLGCKETPQIIQGKIPGHFSELWLRLIPAPRLVNLIRSPWGFKGQLVTFKLESSVTNQELLSRAEQSRIKCGSNFVVANHLESADYEVWFGPSLQGNYIRLERANLPTALLDALEVGGNK